MGLGYGFGYGFGYGLGSTRVRVRIRVRVRVRAGVRVEAAAQHRCEHGDASRRPGGKLRGGEAGGREAEPGGEGVDACRCLIDR